MSDIRVLVLGATGGVGGAVYRALVTRGAQPLAGVRDPARAAARLGPGAACRVIDLDDHATLAPALGGVDALFLLTGYTAAC
jgi:uncharacterized protein YbjT (DUF2867 family)